MSDFVLSHGQISRFQRTSGFYGFCVVAWNKGFSGQDKQQYCQQKNNDENYNTCPFQNS